MVVVQETTRERTKERDASNESAETRLKGIDGQGAFGRITNNVILHNNIGLLRLLRYYWHFTAITVGLQGRARFPDGIHARKRVY